MKIELFRKEYRFLSNFYLCKIVFEDKEYESSEHLYQSMKATNEKDHEYIREATNPFEANEKKINEELMNFAKYFRNLWN